MNEFTVELDSNTVSTIKHIRDVRQAEAECWQRVSDALREYMIRFMDIDDASDVDNLHSIFLPDLVDEIVEDIQSQYPDREKVTK